MDVNAIKEMIKTMDDSKLGYLEVNWQGISIVMRKQGELDFSTQLRNDSNIEVESQNNITEESIETKLYKKEDIIEKIKEEIKPVIEDDNIKKVVSPIVGTFYGSASPDKPSYVKVGSKVKKGDTLCIIEAMKLMNEIQSEVDGEIVEVLVDNQQMVEYGQTMFKIKAQ
jgi:acetyl-CoA carboxylase, biotin carboxyl carrier protein